MTPYYEAPDGKVILYAGHVIDVLREMPAESVNCVVTSPPYWSLRKYDCEPVVWGGDSNCPHTLEPGAPIPSRGYVGDKSTLAGSTVSMEQSKGVAGGYSGKARWQHDGVSRQETPEAWEKASYQIRSNDGGEEDRKQTTNEGSVGRDAPITHATCRLCGAWLGQYGLEPTPELYVEHTLMWLREVRRVLRKDGVLFLNLGDGYYHTNPSGPQGKNGQRASRTFTAEGVGGQVSGAHPYDIEGKVPEGCPIRDSIWSRPCDGCEAAPILRNFHSDGQPVPEPSGDSPDPTQANTESSFDHPATSDCESRTPSTRSSVAMPDQQQSVGPVDVRPPVAPASNLPESSLPLQDGCSHSASRAEGQSLPPSSSLDGQRPSRKASYTADRIETASSSAVHTEGRDHNACPYLHSTMPYRPVQLKPKDAVLMPFRVALAAQADGWWVRSVIIWAKPNPMPESVRDRPTDAHEYIFLLVKNGAQPLYWYLPSTGEMSDVEPRKRGHWEEGTDWEWRERKGGKRIQASLWEGVPYWYDADAVREAQTGNTHSRGTEACNEPYQKSRDSYKGFRSPEVNVPGGRNCRSVWTFPTEPFPDAHFAVFPRELPERCIKAGCPEWVCPKCGKARAQLVKTSRPTNSASEDPTMLTGRAGMNRTRHGPVAQRLKGRETELSARIAVALDGRVEEADELFGRTRWEHWIRGDAIGVRVPPPPAMRILVERFGLNEADVEAFVEGQAGGWTDCGCGAGWVGGVTLDPFAGSGTTCEVAYHLGRTAWGIDASAKYLDMAIERVKQGVLV